MTSWLGGLTPEVVGHVEQAYEEGRSLDTNCVACFRGLLYLCHLAYAPSAQTGKGQLELRTIVRADATTAPSLGFAARLQESANLVHAMLSELNGDRDLKERVIRMLPLLLRALSMDAGAVFVCRDQEAADLLAVYGPTRQRGHPYGDLDLTDSVISLLVQHQRVRELRPTDALQPALEAVSRPAFNYGLLAPVTVGASVVAYVAATGLRAGPLDLSESRTLSTVCDALGPAIHHYTASAESQSNAAVLDSSRAVFHAISRSLDLDETYSEIAANAARAVGGCSCLLLELQAETGELVTVASSEPEPSALMGVRLRFEDDHDLRLTLRSRRSIVVDDLLPGTKIGPEGRRLLGLRSALLVPVHAHGEPIGCLVLYSVGRRRRYLEAEMSRAEDVAEQAAIAIYNARLYRHLVRSRESIESLVKRISDIRQQERQTFASVVHDDIVQSVVGACYLLESFRQTCSDRPADELDEAVKVLQQTVADARRVIWELRPPVLDELGLESSLIALCDQVKLRERIAVYHHIESVSLLSRETATAIYKVAREGVLNAARHAQAKAIWVELREMLDGGRVVQLRVQDDGIGFDVGAAGRNGHFGCAMMEEQATLVAGHLSLRSTPKLGTTVTLVVPITD